MNENVTTNSTVETTVENSRTKEVEVSFTADDFLNIEWEKRLRMSCKLA